jgi:hypothetical protein
MPISFETGATFILLDRFSPVLRELSEKLERFDALVQRTQGHLTELSEIRFAGVNRGLTAMNERLSRLGPTAERAAATVGTSFDGVNAALTRTAELTGTIAANLGAAGRGAARTAAAAASGAAGGGGRGHGGGPLNALLYGSGGRGHGNKMLDEVERYGRMGIVGGALWGAYQAAELRSTIARGQAGGLIPGGEAGAAPSRPRSRACRSRPGCRFRPRPAHRSSTIIKPRGCRRPSTSPNCPSC